MLLIAKGFRFSGMQMNLKDKVLVAQSHLTLCNFMDCIAHEAPLSMEFSRQEYRSGLPFSSPGDLLDLGLLYCRQGHQENL